MNKQKKEEATKVMGNEGAIDIIRFITRNPLGVYIGEIQRNLLLIRPTVKNRLNELETAGIIKAVPDVIRCSPSSTPIRVSKYTIATEYKWACGLLFKD